MKFKINILLFFDIVKNFWLFLAICINYIKFITFWLNTKFNL